MYVPSRSQTGMGVFAFLAAVLLLMQPAGEIREVHFTVLISGFVVCLACGQDDK